MLRLSLKRGEEKVRKNKWRKREGGGVEKEKVRKIKKIKKTQEIPKKKTYRTQNDGLALVQRNAWKSRRKQTGAESYTEKLPKQGMIYSNVKSGK